VQWVRGVRITDFRSLATVELSDLGDVVPIVGPNGSGKSNLMRALNVFFTDRIEGDEPLVLARDFREPGRKRKQEIRIELDLHYGHQMRKELLEPMDRFAAGSDAITVRRRWFRDPLTRQQAHEMSVCSVGAEPVPIAAGDEHLIWRLFGAVPFRYLPNHIHPSQVLRDEEASIRSILFERLGKSQGFSDDQIGRIREAAMQLMRPIAERMLRATGEVRDVELAVPGDWRELLWAFGLRVQAGQSESFEASMHGSGVQSVLAYSVLQMLDTSFRSSFGWRKGAIWAVEEPESFLHSDLQASLARSFADYADGSALQIFLTTHSTAFLGTARAGVSVGMAQPSSDVEWCERQKLLALANSSGVTPFTHPLHAGPLKPLLLVEGRSDRALLARAYEAHADPCPYEILALEDLESDLTGGVDQIVSYLRHNGSALRARPNASPVVALLDWEVTDAKLEQVRKALSDHRTSVAQRLPPDARNVDLSANFTGIEAFLSTAFFEFLASRGALSLKLPGPGTAASWRYDVDRGELKKAKQQLHRALASRDDVSDVAPLIAQIPFVSRLLSPQQTLPVTL
jgi:predicted ATPase